MMDFKCLTKLISIGRSLSARHCDRGGRSREGFVLKQYTEEEAAVLWAGEKFKYQSSRLGHSVD